MKRCCRYQHATSQPLPQDFFIRAPLGPCPGGQKPCITLHMDGIMKRRLPINAVVIQWGVSVLVG